MQSREGLIIYTLFRFNDQWLLSRTNTQKNSLKNYSRHISLDSRHVTLDSRHISLDSRLVTLDSRLSTITQTRKHHITEIQSITVGTHLAFAQVLMLSPRRELTGLLLVPKPFILKLKLKQLSTLKQTIFPFPAFNFENISETISNNTLGCFNTGVNHV